MILVDITNAPHVLFFRPILEELKNCWVFSRKLGETLDLLDYFNIPHQVVGGHWERFKGIYLIYRSFLLFLKTLGKKVDLGLCHASPYLPIALWRRAKTIYFCDNEYTKANFFAKKFANLLVWPEPLKELFGEKKNYEYYDGIKEATYLFDFRPDKKEIVALGLEPYTYVVMRPAPTKANYYRWDDPSLRALKLIREHTDLKVVFLPRYGQKAPEGALSLKTIVYGPNLIWHSLGVVSAGGTMIREACVLGVPAISLYQGKMLKVDEWLLKQGYLTHANSLRVEHLELFGRPKKSELKNVGKEAHHQILEILRNVMG